MPQLGYGLTRNHNGGLSDKLPLGPLMWTNFGNAATPYTMCQRTKSLRDSPLRGGAFLIAMRLGRASIVGRAEPSITVAPAKIFFERRACATLLGPAAEITSLYIV